MEKYVGNNVGEGDSGEDSDKDSGAVEWLILCYPRGFGNRQTDLVFVKSLSKIET